MRRFDGYHRGWAGDHFDEIIVVRVVEENATRRRCWSAARPTP